MRQDTLLTPCMQESAPVLPKRGHWVRRYYFLFSDVFVGTNDPQDVGGITMRSGYLVMNFRSTG